MAPGRGVGILPRLPHAVRIDVERRYTGRGRPLGQHERNQTGTGAHVEHPPVRIPHGGPGTEQNAVRAHLHGAPVLPDGELFESEHSDQGLSIPDIPAPKRAKS